MQIRIQGFDEQKLIFIYTPRPPTSSTSKYEISSLYIFMGNFCPPGSEIAFPVRSRIKPAKMDTDPQPDYKHGENVGNILQRRMLDSDTVVLTEP
jgi:hypothetical protein